MFYDGDGWANTAFGHILERFSNKAKRRRLNQLLWWHQHMFRHLMALIPEDLEWVKASKYMI